MAEAERRRRRIQRTLEAEGRWVDDEEVRRELTSTDLVPGPGEFRPEQPPPLEDGLERLPLYFDERAGPVALARGPGGWEALEVFPEGGTRSVGRVVPTDRPSALAPDAERLLSGYLRYCSERDAFLGAVHVEMMSVSEGTVTDIALEELRTIGSDVLARAFVRAQLDGHVPARLERADIERGIRATDQDWLDRPTWGDRL